MAEKEEDNSSTTVRFNVGGTVYEVSRSLLDAFPNTMLARMASKTWMKTKDGAPDDAPLFIERSGTRFEYCLDYMRDGSVSLPTCISKTALLKDLEYYNFENVDPSRIDAAKDLRETIKEVVREISDEEVCTEFAYECFQKGTRAYASAADNLLEYNAGFNQYPGRKFGLSEKARRLRNSDIFQKCMAKHGVKYTNFELYKIDYREIGGPYCHNWSCKRSDVAEEYKRSLKEKSDKKDCTEFAYWCFDEITFSAKTMSLPEGNSNFSTNSNQTLRDKQLLYDISKKVYCLRDSDVFKECMAVLGMKCTNFEFVESGTDEDYYRCSISKL